MNRHIKLAVCTMIWLTGVAVLVSCTTSPLPETPSQEEQASRSSREPDEAGASNAPCELEYWRRRLRA